MDVNEHEKLSTITLRHKLMYLKKKFIFHPILRYVFFVKCLLYYDIVTGGLDNCVKIWDVNRVLQEFDTDSDLTIPSSLVV